MHNVRPCVIYDGKPICMSDFKHPPGATFDGHTSLCWDKPLIFMGAIPAIGDFIVWHHELQGFVVVPAKQLTCILYEGVASVAVDKAA